MATQTASNGQDRGSGRGRRGNRGRGRNRGGQERGRGGRSASEVHSSRPVEDPTEETKEKSQVTDQTANDKEEAEDGIICWICAEPVKYWSVSECNHRTCHVCALRLRALYKKTDCTFCKEPQPSVIFTTSADALWSSYTPDVIPYKDPKLSIFFETQEMMEDSLILLRFNCSVSTCDYIANGWSDLKLHIRAMHGKVLCDLCIRFKKIFAHEHILYSPNQLPFHLPSLQRGPRNPPKEPPEGGVHPFCEFCREAFFDDDALYVHMRERHEDCFICKRNEVRDQYFRDYNALEQHFNHGHFPCNQSACLARKFVVFGSAMDLKAHMVEEHSAEMSSRDKKDARRIQADFEFEEVGGPGRRGRRDRGDREREREPPPPGPPRPGAAGARRREAFGGTLTTEAPASTTPVAGTSRIASRRTSPSPAGDVDPAIAERHTAFLTRISSLASNPNTAVPAVKFAVRAYRSNESTARDLISTVWNTLDRNLEGTAGIINGLVDLLDDEDKKKDLLQAWNGFKIEQRNQFPELIPSGSGSEYAGITGGRLLNAKQSTTTRSASQSSRQILDRVARAAASSSAFPAPRATAPAERFHTLPSSSSTASGSGYKQPARQTPWASSNATSAAPPAPTFPSLRGPVSVPGPGARSKPGPPPSLSKSAFPELVSTNNTTRVPKSAVSGNRSLRNILGESAPVNPAWQPGGSRNDAGDSGPVTPNEEGELGQNGGGGKGKKGKGKQKQTLFTLGTIPS